MTHRIICICQPSYRALPCCDRSTIWNGLVMLVKWLASKKYTSPMIVTSGRTECSCSVPVNKVLSSIVQRSVFCIDRYVCGFPQCWFLQKLLQKFLSQITSRITPNTHLRTPFTIVSEISSSIFSGILARIVIQLSSCLFCSINYWYFVCLPVLVCLWNQ